MVYMFNGSLSESSSWSHHLLSGSILCLGGVKSGSLSESSWSCHSLFGSISHSGEGGKGNRKAGIGVNAYSIS